MIQVPNLAVRPLQKELALLLFPVRGAALTVNLVTLSPALGIPVRVEPDGLAVAILDARGTARRGTGGGLALESVARKRCR